MVVDATQERIPGGGRVLLAEDDPITRELMVDFLQSAGLVVDVVEDGALAVERAAATAYAVILMDMEMPHMDGVEAARRIRCLPSHRQTPICALTAHASAEERERCVAAGMADFITKPVESQLLHGILLRWLPGGAQRQPAATGDAPRPASGTGVDPPQVGALPGIDPTDFLAALHGDTPRYRRLLERMCNAQAGDLDRLRSHLAAGDRAAAAQVAHGLAGAALMLGAVRLGETARTLEQSLRAHDPSDSEAAAITSGVEAFGAELAVLRDALRQQPLGGARQPGMPSAIDA